MKSMRLTHFNVCRTLFPTNATETAIAMITRRTPLISIVATGVGISRAAAFGQSLAAPLATKGKNAVPLARIDINRNTPADHVRIISNAVYGAMTEIANVPLHDKFQIITRHDADEIVYPEEGYLGIAYSPDIIFIQVTWVSGRTTDVKKQFYRRIADEIHEKAGVRKEDVWISLVESGREDWSFGNGDMQYGPK